MSTVKITLPPKREGMSEEKAREFAMRVIGYHFTVVTIAAMNNPKVAGFKEDAESCLEKVDKWNTAAFWSSVWALVNVTLCVFIVLRVYNRGIGVMHEWQFPTAVIVVVVTGIIGCIHHMQSCLTEADRPGDTTRMVARLWKPWRKRILSTKLVPTLAAGIRWCTRQDDAHTSRKLVEIESWRFDGEELRKSLSSAALFVADEAATQFKLAEQDGTNRDRKRSRNQFYEADKIGQQLGFARLDWENLNA